MGRLTRPLILLLLLPSGVDSVLAGDPDPLWLRAVEVCEQSRGAMATKVTITSESRDVKPGVTCRKVDELSLRSVTADGEVDWHRVSTEQVFPSDADPEEACRWGIDAEGEIVVPLFGMGPLLASEQRRVKVKGVLGARELGDRRCVAYTFRWRRKLGSRRRYEGQACLEAETGAPLEVSYWPRSPLRGTASVVTTLRYRQAEGVGWIIAEFDVVITGSNGTGASVRYELNAELSEHRPFSELLRR